MADAQAGTGTQRLNTKKQTIGEAYDPPANFLEIEIVNALTHGVAKNRYTDYEIRVRVRLTSCIFYKPYLSSFNF